MLWFGLRERLDALQHQMERLELGVPALVASLENATDLYNRASSRFERSGINQRAREGNGGNTLAASSLEEVRRRRGGL